MNPSDPRTPSTALGGIRRSPVQVAQEEDGIEFLSQDRRLPAVFQCKAPASDPIAWAQTRRTDIEARLWRYGAVLFRGFPIQSPARFRAFAAALSHELLEYTERSSPRSQVASNIYTSTDYPASESIFPHNEHSYSHQIPRRLFFFCETPAQRGGQTPIADCRRVLARIPPRIVEAFEARRWMYMRNLGGGMGLAWQAVFQTTERDAVEAYCHDADIALEWRPNDRVRTKQIRSAIARHPETGERVWFNHATFFHLTTLRAEIQEELRREFADEDLPNQTYFGDGSPIPDEDVAALRDAYARELVSFDWQRGDVLMVDNILTAHARAPYAGARRVLVAMADPVPRELIEATTVGPTAA